jgi:hypothetical protein
MNSGAHEAKHDYAREIERDDEGNHVRSRLHCSCGKRSRWSETSRPVMQAQDKHADDVARGGC